MAAKKQRQDKPSLSVRDIAAQPNPSPSALVLDLLIDEAASKIVDSKGTVVEEYTPDKLTLRMTVVWVTDRWRADQALLVTG